MNFRKAEITELLSMLEAAKGKGTDIKFVYENVIYETGVRTESGRNYFYFDDEEYPSMLSYKSNVCIEGVSVCEFRDSIAIIEEN